MKEMNNEGVECGGTTDRHSWRADRQARGIGEGDRHKITTVTKKRTLISLCRSQGRKKKKKKEKRKLQC